ncbi:hypothetical protein [Clostridium sp.]
MTLSQLIYVADETVCFYLIEIVLEKGIKFGRRKIEYLKERSSVIR